MIAHLAVLGLLTLSQNGGGPHQMQARRIAPPQLAPVLDGRLDDVVWAQADSVSGFTQREPDPGQPSRFRTVARVVFDDHAVYVALHAFDPEPQKIVAQLTRRDEGSPSDWLWVGFDSRFDRRTSYWFGVNPAGVKMDFFNADGGRGDDLTWDAVWDVATQRDSSGWTAEYHIPLSALRFSTAGEGTWGFQVSRMVQRVKEQSFWAPVLPNDPTLVARFGELRGLTGLRPPRRLEVMPYTVTSLTGEPADAGDPFHSGTRWGRSVGLDVKYGLTSNLTLDATFNPDFGQVEADPSQVNLSAYETFLAERRPFFNEGSEIFRFGLGLGDDNNEQLLYSRRIGRAPHGSPDTPEGGFRDVPTQTTILGAGKLSGQLGRGWSLGALGAVTAEERARLSDGAGARSEPVVEPLSSYSVLRLRRELNAGRTQVGLIGSAVARRLDGTGMDELRSSALVGGVDFAHRWATDQWLLSGSLLGSRIGGSAEAILDAQESSVRYFQRPDADHLQVDSSATVLSGWAAKYELSNLGGRWRGGVLGVVRSPGFEANDLGYQREADQIFNVVWAGYRNPNPDRRVRGRGLNTNLWHEQNFGGQRTALGSNLNGWVQLRNYWYLRGGVNHDLSSWAPRALRGGPAVRFPTNTGGWLGFNTDDRKPLRLGLTLQGGVRQEDAGHDLYTSLDTRWRLSPSVSFSAAPFYSLNHDGWQYVDRLDDDAGAPHYLFGELDQRTFGVDLRLNQTFTPTLSFQFFARPFLSAGRYVAFREVRDARAERFSERFRTYAAGEVRRTQQGDDRTVTLTPAAGPVLEFGDPDFNVRDFKLNAVLRWEYRPGSTFFVVWSHDRGGDGEPGRFRLRRDLDDLFREPATNVLLLKANWWMKM